MNLVRRVGVGLGANLGDRIANLRFGFERLARISSGTVKVSAVYETEPVGCAAGSPWFLNAVCEIGWTGDIRDLLRRTQVIEVDAGRTRGGRLCPSRTLDIDLLYVDDLIVRTTGLTIPHPRMGQRRFVLQPLWEIRPELFLPGQSRSVGELLATLGDVHVVRRYFESLD